MGYSDSDSGCKRHPTHKQIPGVCPSCLRERLTKLDTSSVNNSYKTAKSTISNASSSCISSSSSTPTYSTASSSSTRHFLQPASSSSTTKNRTQSKINSTTTTRPRTSQQNHRRTGSDTGVPLGFVLHYGSSKGVRSTTYTDVKGGGGGGGVGSKSGMMATNNITASSTVSGLKKSRSVACAPRIYRGGSRNGGKRGVGIGSGDGESTTARLKIGKGSGGDGVDSEVEEFDQLKSSGSVHHHQGKKSGFWKKLIHSTSKKTKGVLTHSKSTLKERSSSNHQQL